MTKHHANVRCVISQLLGGPSPSPRLGMTRGLLGGVAWPRNCSRSPLHPGCGYTSANPERFRGCQSWGVNPQRFLEGEIEAGAEHSEIIFRPINHAKTQVVSPTEVPRDSEFETGPELAE